MTKIEELTDGFLIKNFDAFTPIPRLRKWYYGKPHASGVMYPYNDIKVNQKIALFSEDDFYDTNWKHSYIDASLNWAYIENVLFEIENIFWNQDKTSFTCVGKVVMVLE